MATSAPAQTTGWAVRLHAGLDWLLWVMTVNALWYLFALAGGIVFGVAPASAAAAELTRRKLRGEGFRAVGEFAVAWRREFVRANLALGPAFVALVALVIGVAGQAQAGGLGSAFGTLSLIALGIVAVVSAVAVPMYAHYELPLNRYISTACRWVLGNLIHVVLIALGAVTVVGASWILPGIIPFVSLGAWITIDTALCVAFFTANDRRLAERDLAGR